MAVDPSFTDLPTLPPEMDDHLVKVIFVGSAGVGKTCLVRRLFSDAFNPDTRATVGCDFHFKRYMFDKKSIGVTLWDTAGTEKFQAVTSNYYRGAQGVVLVYDVTRRETLDAIERLWLPEVDRFSTFPEAVKMVVGNKIDMEGERQVSPEEGAAFALRHGCMYSETSARTDAGVYDALVWGVLVNIVDTPSLLRSNEPERLRIEQPAGGEGGEGEGRRTHGAGGGSCCG
ncbi:RABC1 protein [Gonium pectorale]|uniref:RABC1 protein n=1 Tax=Gonium pectorale TaxID=33097 RepID=A0A150GWX2_GONPE|nr:RABC1 protein [Gonium pectorale]|eukprot:KXZ54309.1 RABC1 protein [Gonium pectorale]